MCGGGLRMRRSRGSAGELVSESNFTLLFFVSLRATSPVCDFSSARMRRTAGLSSRERWIFSTDCLNSVLLNFFGVLNLDPFDPSDLDDAGDIESRDLALPELVWRDTLRL